MHVVFTSFTSIQIILCYTNSRIGNSCERITSNSTYTNIIGEEIDAIEVRIHPDYNRRKKTIEQAKGDSCLVKVNTMTPFFIGGSVLCATNTVVRSPTNSGP